jgi:Ca2+-binding EF-hand superfamily protein
MQFRPNLSLMTFFKLSCHSLSTRSVGPYVPVAGPKQIIPNYTIKASLQFQITPHYFSLSRVNCVTMQNNQRNDDVRRYSRRTSARITPPMQPSTTLSQGDDAQRVSPSNKQAMTTRRSSRLSSSYHSAGAEINQPTNTSPVKASSLHDPSNRQNKVGRGLNSSRQSIFSDSSGLSSTDRGKIKRPGSVSPFLKNTHRDLKQQIVKLQGHIKFIQELATLNDEKRIDLLFQMIDRDGGGTVDAEELAAAMRRNDELSFSDSIEKAIDMVALFDKDGNLNMDKDEFREYVSAMVKELGVSVPDFTEFLIVQLLLSEETDEEKKAGEMARDHINEEVKKRQELMVVLASEFIAEAYEMLDVDNLGEIPFHTVAIALTQATKNESKAAQKALSVLLMVDKNDTRVINYEHFGKLMISIAKTTGKSFDEVADDVMYTIECQPSLDETTANSHSTSTETMNDYVDTVDELTNRRLKQLFHLWDVDGNGDITRDELADGLDKFQRASGINVDANAMAQALVVGFTDDSNPNDTEQLLHFKEFAQAMILYAEQFGVEIHSLIDFMCSTSSNQSTDQRRKSRTKGNNRSKKKQFHGEEFQVDPADNAEVDFWEDF